MKGWFSWQYLFNSHLCMAELVSLAAACAMNSLLYQVGEGQGTLFIGQAVDMDNVITEAGVVNLTSWPRF